MTLDIVEARSSWVGSPGSVGSQAGLLSSAVAWAKQETSPEESGLSQRQRHPQAKAELQLPPILDLPAARSARTHHTLNRPLPAAAHHPPDTCLQ